MNFTLLRKEVIEHGWILLILVPLIALGFGLMLLGSHLNHEGSALNAVMGYALSLLPLAQMMVCNRLVVNEYTRKTQLFLEGLPISRTGMLTTKFLLGLFIVGLPTAIALLFAAFVSSWSEPISGRFAAIMSSRLAVYVFVTYSFFFMMGLLGRYRLAIYIFLFLMVMAVSELTSFEFTEHGPLRLVDSRFAFEREIFPTRELFGNTIAGCVFVVISMLLGLAREGSIAGMLAEKMSYREKVFLAGILLAIIPTVGVLSEKQRPDPYTITDAVVKDGSGFRLEIEPSAVPERSEQLAQSVYDDILSVREFLGMSKPLHLFLVNRSDLDADEYEPATLHNASGLLLRVNFESDDWDYQGVRNQIIHEYLTRTSEPANYEPTCWVLDGFAEYWSLMKANAAGMEPINSAVPDAANKSRLRAMFATKIGTGVSDFETWYRFRERVGRPLSQSVGCALLMHARNKHGDRSVQQFVRGYLDGNLPNDIRGTFRSLTHPIAEVWSEAFGEDYRESIRECLSQLASDAEREAEFLAEIPRLSASAETKERSDVSFDMMISPELTPADEIPIEVLYQKARPFKDVSDDRSAESQTENYRPAMSIRLQPVFSRGDTVRWTARIRSEKLDCKLISGWKRLEVQ